MLLATASMAASLMVRGLRSYSLTASMGSVSMFTAISVRTRSGKRQRVGRRGGPPHMRQVRGAGMAGSLVGWIARAYGPVRGALNAPNLARYRPRPLATGPPTLAHVASLAGRRTNPATGPPRARTAQTNSVAKRGCSRGRFETGPPQAEYL